MSLFTIPFPPGVNNLFNNGAKGRYPTDRYKAWRKLAADALKIQKPKPVEGPFTLSIKLHKPDRRKRDLDGLLKAPLDALVEAGLIQDDSLAMKISLEWVSNEPMKNGPVYVGLYPYGQSGRV